MQTPKSGYIETEAVVQEAYYGTMEFIIDGNVLHKLFDVKGMCVYSLIRLMRENDELFYDDSSPLNVAQRERLELVEAAIGEAITKGMQYYPFGHEDEFKRVLSMKDRDNRQRAMHNQSTSTITATARQRRSRVINRT